MGKAENELHLRIVVVSPPSGVMFALQRGKADLISTTMSTGADLVFELAVRVGLEDSAPNLLGSYVQGPRGGRFVYIRSGTLAGQTDSCWTRRAKVGLQGITRDLIARATAKDRRIIEARIKGTATDGGPSCGTVLLLDGWKVVHKTVGD